MAQTIDRRQDDLYEALQRSLLTRESSQHAEKLRDQYPELAECIWLASVLSRIDRWDSLPLFVEHGISDLWFPFPKQTLRHFLNDGKSEKNFLRVQAELFQEVWPDPMVEPVPHLIFDDGEEIVKSKRILGEGGFAIVEEVTLPTTPLPTVCVRKRIDRHRQLRTQKQIMEAFIREIKIMGLVDHHHCVKFLGSYTDHDSLCILSLPIADMDLATYLKVESLNREQLEVIRRGMGCLCNALHYLHEEEIRHEDLKPQNVLVHGKILLLTDFGFSLDFSDDSVSTTIGRPSHWTARYSAPETLDHRPRNRATDIWSLGCILVEMLSRLNGHSLSRMTTFWKTRGNGHPSFAMNTDATTSWLEQLFHNTKGDSKASILYELIRTTLQPDRLQRPSAQQIVDKIQDLELLFPSSPAFVENCCKGRGLNSDEACGFSNLNGFVDLTRCPEYLYPDALDSHTFLLVDPDGITFGFKENWPMEKSFGKHLDTYFKSPNDLNDIFDRLRKSVNLAAYVEKRAACELTVRSHEDGEFLARLSLRINSVNKLSFERTTCEIRLPVRSSEHRLRLVQVSIMPICFPRSELHGRPFFVISFMPDKEYDDDTNLFPTPPSTINCRIREWLLDCLKGSSLEKARYLNILEQNLDIFSISDFDLGTWEDLLVSFWDSDTSDSLPPLPPMDPLPTSHHNNQHPCADLGSTLSSTRFQGDDCQLDRICLQPTQIYDANSRFAGLPPLVNSYVYPTMINLVDGQAVVAPVLDMSSEETAESYLSSVYPWYLLDMEPAPGNKVPFTTSDDISRMDAIPMYQARDLLQTPHPQPFDSPLTSVAESHTDSLAERSLVVTKKPHRSLSIDLGRVNIRNLCTPEVRHARRWSISTSKDMCGKGNQEWEMIDHCFASNARSSVFDWL